VIVVIAVMFVAGLGIISASAVEIGSVCGLACVGMLTVSSSVSICTPVARGTTWGTASARPDRANVVRTACRDSRYIDASWMTQECW